MCIFAHRQQLMKKPLQISGLFLVVSLFFSYSVVAQNINFVATAKSTVETGEQFRVIYELNAEGERFTGPDFGQLRVITGPMTSSSSSIQLINGQMSRSFTQSYTYVVTAANPGDINVGPASIYVDGTKINSNSLSIKVLATSSGQIKPKIKVTRVPETAPNKQQYLTKICISKHPLIKITYSLASRLL